MIGGMNHPHGCTECSFYFFGPSGCRAGAGCKFCHSFHPRRKARKNRRIIRRLGAEADGDKDAEPADDITEDGGSPDNVFKGEPTRTRSQTGKSDGRNRGPFEGSADAAGGQPEARGECKTFATLPVDTAALTVPARMPAPRRPEVAKQEIVKPTKFPQAHAEQSVTVTVGNS